MVVLVCAQMKLAVTGITSGIGKRLADVAIERGDTIAALVRDPMRDDARNLGARGVRLVRGDLDDRAALVEVARGADVFVHMAAHVGDWGPLAQFERVNVDGTRNAVEAAAAAGVPRFLQLSSTAVYGRPDRGRVTEEWPTRKIGLPYEDTKTAAERLAFERGAELGLSVVAVRPPIVYGPYDKNFMPRALDALRHRRFLLVDGGRAPLNVVWVDHVIDVLLRAADRSDIRGEAFNVMDDVAQRPPSVREVGETIAREAGLPPPKLSLPFPVAMAAGVLLERAYVIARAAKPPPISPFVVRLLTRDVVYDASKAARMLGWKPQLAALEGIARFAREASGAAARA
jgi:nucleoside-diphosphate-sugar epimerase